MADGFAKYGLSAFSDYRFFFFYFVSDFVSFRLMTDTIGVPSYRGF